MEKKEVREEPDMQMVLASTSRTLSPYSDSHTGMVASRAHLGALTTPIVDGPPVLVTGELSAVAVAWGLGRP